MDISLDDSLSFLHIVPLLVTSGSDAKCYFAVMESYGLHCIFIIAI